MNPETVTVTQLEQAIAQQKRTVQELTAQFLTAKLAAVPDQEGNNPSQDAINAVANRKKAMDEAVTELNSMYGALRAIAPPPQAMRHPPGDLKKKQECRKHVQEAVKTFGNNRFYGRSTCNARDFWNEYKTFLINQNYEETEIWEYAVPILKSLVKARYSELWFNNSVTPNLDPQFSLTDLEKLFIDGWVDTITKSLEEVELHTFAWGKESAITFVNRMNALYAKMNVPIDNTRTTTPGVGNLISELYTRIPNSVRASPVIRFKEPEGYETINELLGDIRSYPNVPGDIQLAHHVCFYCSGHVTWQCKQRCDSYQELAPRTRDSKAHNRGATKTSQAKETGTCDKHPNSNHSNDECFSRKRQRSDDSSMSGSTSHGDSKHGNTNHRQALREKGLCFKCEKPYSRDHVCAVAPAERPFKKLVIDTKMKRAERPRPVPRASPPMPSSQSLGSTTQQFQRMEVEEDSSEYNAAATEIAEQHASENYFQMMHLDLKDAYYQCTLTELDPIRNSFSLIRVPLEINGLKVLAVLDTYSTFSILAPSLAKQLGLKVMADQTALTLRLGNGSAMESREVTEPASVKSGDKNWTHQFRVFDMGSEENRAVVGLDLFYKLGLKVENLQPTWPKLKPWPVEHTVDKENKSETLFYLKFQDKLRPLLDKNDQLRGPCTHPDAKIAFETTPGVTINVRQYPQPFRHHATIAAQIKKWLDEGHIKEDVHTANVEWNVPILVVPKKNLDGTIKGWRVCLDPRRTNLIMKISAYPIPRIEDVLAKLRGSGYFTKLDLRQAFHQFLLRQEDCVKTTFTWDNSRYYFLVAPFGYKPIPNEVQRIVRMIFGNAHAAYLVVYIDDLIIYSRTEEEHVQHVATVLKVLNSHNLRLQVEKVVIGTRSCEVLGNIVTEVGTSIALEKLVQIKGWKNPTSGKMVQQQLGFFNFFRALIPGYGRLMSPLDKLRNQAVVQWQPQHQEIYDKLLTIMRDRNLVLVNPDFNLRFYIATDASKYGIGGVLYQRESMGTSWKPRYIMFASRALTGAEIHYGATKRELLAIVWCLERMRNYVWGSTFTVETDHNALTFMFTQKKINSTIANWLETLLDFDFDVVHCPGIQHVLPDRISRFYDHDNPSILDQEAVLCQTYQEESGLENVLDDEQRQLLIKRAHLMGHFGAAAMTKAIHNDGYSWSGIKDQCQEVVSKCLPCQRYNIGRHGYHPLKNLKALMPFDHVSIDLKEMVRSDRNNQYYLLLIDVATKFVFLRPLHNKEMETVARALFGIFCDVGFPVIISMDNGKEFVNRVIADMVRISLMDRRLFTPYHHRGNGIAERAIRTTSEMIYKLLEGKDTDWDLYLPSTQYFINLKVSETTGSTPYSLMFARAAHSFLTTAMEHKELNLDVIRKRLDEMTEVVYPAIQRKTDTVLQKRNEIFQKNHQILKEPFPDGTTVMCIDENRRGKSEPRYEGPFVIKRRNKAGVYVLTGKDGSEYTRPGHALKIVHPDIVDPTPNDSVGVVKRILNDTRNAEGEALYLVQWENTNKQSWVHNQDFHDHGPIRNYWKQKDKSNASATRIARQEPEGIVGREPVRENTINKRVQFGAVDVIDNQHQTLGVPVENPVTESPETTVATPPGIEPYDERLPKELRSDLAGYFNIPESGKRKRPSSSYKE